MAPNPNGFSRSYTCLAKDCRHIVRDSVPSQLDSKHSTSSDSEADEYPVSTNIFLCPVCEQDLHDQRQEAECAYELIYDGGKGERNDDLREAAEYYRAATIRIVNFNDRMADRTNTAAQAEAVAAREKKWEAGKRVSFAVEEGMGSGEKEKKKKAAIILGPPSDSAYTFSYSLPVRAIEDS